MRTTTVQCSRCGSTCLGGHSILRIEAGELAKRRDEPWIELCASCADRFEDWLRSAQEAVHTGVGSVSGGSGEESSVLAG